jgi:branched-chain amino acid transport system ATP-binding protein
MSGAVHPLLQVSHVDGGYGDVGVLHGLSLSIYAGELTCIVGSNGAGKSTLLRTLAGLNPPFSGEIALNGERIDGYESPDVVERGLVLVPEGRRLFAGMSVEHNLLMGGYVRRDKKAQRRLLDEIYAMFPKLAARRKQEAVTLSGGEQQMCAIGRGLMAQPKLLLIDELSLGLAPLVVDELVEKLQQINAAGTTLLVVEQDVAIAMTLARHAFVLDQGRLTQSGPTAVLMNDPAVRAAYLGEAGA